MTGDNRRMRHIAILAVCAAILAPIAASEQVTRARISGVTVDGSAHDYTITIRGTGLGQWPSSLPPLPYTGDIPYFRIGDVGKGEAGFIGDAYTVSYQTWTPNEIRIGYNVAIPNDNFLIVVHNPKTHLGSAWAGVIPPATPGRPIITSVTLSGSGQQLRIVITGFGFGKDPSVGFSDWRMHPFSFNNQSSLWDASDSGPITLVYSERKKKRIVIEGFAGTYGSGSGITQYAALPNDPIAITVTNHKTGLWAHWGGNVP